MRSKLALLTAAALFCTLTACAGTPDPSPSGEDAVPAALSHACRSVPLTEDPDLENAALFPAKDLLLMQGYRESDETTVLALFDGTDDSMVKIGFGNDEVIAADLSEDTLTLFCSQFLAETQSYRHTLRTFDTELNVLGTEDVTDKWGSDVWIYDWCRCPDGSELISGDHGIVIAKPDSTPQEIACSGEFPKFCQSPDGTVWIVPNGETALRLDPDLLTLQTPGIPGLPQQNVSNGGYYNGSGNYDLLFSDETALYGLHAASGETEELINFAASNFTEFSGCMALADGRFILRDEGAMVGTGSLWLLTRRTQAEADSMKTISVAAVNFYQEDMSRIARFNRQADGCRLVVKEYCDNDGNDYDKAQAQFYQDLLTGSVPDMVLLWSNYEMLANKGLFEDLRPWMERDPDFHEADYLMPVLDSLSYKGHLERICFNFSAHFFAMKSRFAGQKNTLTPQELLTLDLPEGMQLFDNSGGQEMAFQRMIVNNLGGFVNYENGTCSFDSDEFITLLELVGSIPKGNSVNGADCYQNDRVLLSDVSLRSLMDLRGAKEVTFRDEDIQLMGINPSGESGGIIRPLGMTMISAQSEHKEICWEYIKFCLREENQINTRTSFLGFPVNRAALEKKITYETRKDASRGHSYETPDGEQISFSDPTPQDAQEVTAYLDNLHECVYLDENVIAIVQEESGKYFSGDCTAQNAAETIQGRVQIYLSEQN